jgi:hypothetical protein
MPASLGTNGRARLSVGSAATSTAALAAAAPAAVNPTDDPIPAVLDNITSLDDFTSPKMKVLREKLEALKAQATPADHAEADAIRHGIPNQSTVDRKISPVVCAILVLGFNTKNRDISIAKLDGFVEDMDAGDWKFHHQGIAFTPEGMLGDGQHRLIAGALSGKGLHIKVSTDFDMDAIDAIDRSATRSAAQALTMKGMTDAKAKVEVCRQAISYMEASQHGFKPRLSEQRLERALRQNEQTIANALAIGRSSTKNVTEPMLNWADASSWAAIALLSGWDPSHVVGFLAAVQQGIATYSDSPTLVLNRLLKKAKDAEKRKDRLSAAQRLALTVKAAGIWSRKLGVSRLLWDEKREGYPDPSYAPTDPTGASMVPAAAE